MSMSWAARVKLRRSTTRTNRRIASQPVQSGLRLFDNSETVMPILSQIISGMAKVYINVSTPPNAAHRRKP